MNTEKTNEMFNEIDIWLNAGLEACRKLLEESGGDEYYEGKIDVYLKMKLMLADIRTKYEGEAE